MPRGEWWIDDGGQVTFADGDVGDQNHESVAFWSAIELSDEDPSIPEGVSPNGIDLTALGEDLLSELGVSEDIVDVAKWPEDQWAQFLEDNDLDPFNKNEGGYSWGREEVLGLNKLVSLGANMNFVWWWHQSSQQDSREYAIEKDNWIRVKDDNFEMQTFDDDALQRIRNADFWEEEEEPEKLKMSDETVGIEERSTGRFFNIPLRVLFDSDRNAASIIRYGEGAEEGGEEHLALNPGPERFWSRRAHMETYSSVGDKMKGILTPEGRVVAWEIDHGGAPHHDEVAEAMGLEYVARMTHDTNRNELYVDASGSLFGSVAQAAVRSFTGIDPNMPLRIDSDSGRLVTTFNGYGKLLRYAPDPDDYEDGENDSYYLADMRGYVEKINQQKVIELLGRERSPEHTDDPHVHLALNPVEETPNIETYMSYGHGKNSKIWIWKRGFLVVRDFDPGEGHYEQFGDETQKNFFGRYDPEEDVITIAPPGGNPFAVAPQALRDELEMEFGSSARIVEFNPVRIRAEHFYDPRELAMGVKVEREHTDSPTRASKIARQHLEETPDYYTRLDEAGLADNPPKVTPQTKAIIVGDDVIVWPVDRAGQPDHRRVMSEQGIRDDQVDAFLHFARTPYIFSGVGIVLAKHSQKSQMAIDEAREIVRKHVDRLNADDEIEVLSISGRMIWRGPAIRFAGREMSASMSDDEGFSAYNPAEAPSEAPGQAKPPELMTPDVLYHGTTQGALRKIVSEGLKPTTMNQVSLSETEEYAKAYADRKGGARGVILRVSGVDATPDTRISIKGDFRSAKTIPVEKLEVKMPDGAWAPLAGVDVSIGTPEIKPGYVREGDRYVLGEMPSPGDDEGFSAYNPGSDVGVEFGYGGTPEGFKIESPSGVTAIGYAGNADFPYDSGSPTRGELFLVNVPVGQRGTGAGMSISIQALQLMKRNGCRTVNMHATSSGGVAIVNALIREGYISRAIRISDTGKSEYQIL
jgi:hypothetical protein